MAFPCFYLVFATDLLKLYNGISHCVSTIFVHIPRLLIIISAYLYLSKKEQLLLETVINEIMYISVLVI